MSKPLLEKILETRGFFSFMGAALTGSFLYFHFPFPATHRLISMIALRDPVSFHFLRVTFYTFFFATPFFIYSFLTSMAYLFMIRSGRKRRELYDLPPYPEATKRKQLCLVIGEIHHPARGTPAEHPRWLVIPDRGLFTGIAIFGAIGTGKTSGAMYPFAYQMLAFQSRDRKQRIGGLVLEVKGDFCHKIRGILEELGRPEDYIELGLESSFCYNPLHNDLDAYALAYGVASLLNNLFGKGKEPFWQQAYTNLVKFLILLHKVLYDYVTLFDVYVCAISPELLKKKIAEGEKLFAVEKFITLQPQQVTEHEGLHDFKLEFDEELDSYRVPLSDKLENFLKDKSIPFNGPFERTSSLGMDHFRREQFEAVHRWFKDDWMSIDQKLRTSIVEGISVFLSLFDDNPKVKRTFCPPKECFDSSLNPDGRYGRPLPNLGWLIENGKVLALNFPFSLNAGLAKAIGTLLKMDFQRAVLNRIPEIEKNPNRHYRQVFFICDEYHQFATTGENDPNGDEKAFSLSRQARLIPIIATQSVSSIKSAVPGETWRTLLQTFRTKIFLALSDDFSARFASELCGKEDKLKINYNLSESSQNAKVSFLFGRPMADKSSLSTSKSYTVHRDFTFDQNVFSQLKNGQTIVIAYDGINPLPPCFCHLKPYYLPVNKSYFRQLADGEI
jgi:hypothetical protein